MCITESLCYTEKCHTVPQSATTLLYSVMPKRLAQHCKSTIVAESLGRVLLLCDTMRCSQPDSSVHGISQARILEWVVISFSEGSSWPRDPACFSRTGRRMLYRWATGEPKSTMEVKVKVPRSWQTLCDQADFTVGGILQARILEWVTFPASRGSSQPRDQTKVSLNAGGFFTSWATGKIPNQLCFNF